jgi:hypothetical protein
MVDSPYSPMNIDPPPIVASQVYVSQSFPWIFRLKWGPLGYPLLLGMTSSGLAAMAVEMPIIKINAAILIVIRFISCLLFT